MESMTAINWPLLILIDSPEFHRKLTIAEMGKMRPKLQTKGLMEIGETCIQGTSPIQILS